MAMLIDIRDPDWMRSEQLKEILQPLMPNIPIYCDSPGLEASKITVLATSKLFPGVVSQLPNLQLVQKIGAGVDSIVSDPDLPEGIQIARLKPDIPAHEIAEYFLCYVLQHQRNVRFHQDNQQLIKWVPRGPVKSWDTTVAVLGLGHIGARTANYFHSIGFNVVGWSRSAKNLAGVDCRHGDDALAEVLATADYVAAILPSTSKTRGLFNRNLMQKMKKGAVLLNAGRGDLIVETDLLDCLNDSHLGGAVLDVFNLEPLAEDSPLWQHPLVTLTPHVSGWHLDGGLEDIAENYLRLAAGETLLHLVDRKEGY